MSYTEVPTTATTWVEEEAATVEHDDFFDGDPDVLASFAFDYEAIIAFKTKFLCTQLLFPPALVLSSLCCYPCFLQQNVEWSARAQHVALTQDGIKFVEDRRKTLCGFSCTDAGKKSKTVPYDKLTDCDIEEPAGNACCCCVRNTLNVVNVDTASSGGAGTPEHPAFHELTLVGLKNPHAFKRAVWAMKRGEPTRGISVPESLYVRGRQPLAAAAKGGAPGSDLEKRARAFDAYLSECGLGVSATPGAPGLLTKVDFLLADRDYATDLLDAFRLQQRGLITPDEFTSFRDGLAAKISSSSSSASSSSTKA